MSGGHSNLLPKGIVVNAPNIEQSIERLAGEPVDGADIERMWKVYTTTQRRLLDPTAIRLEQFWWRIWGSQRRELSASTIAAVYADISHGETFVPLLGPSNRDEGGSKPPNPAIRRPDPIDTRPTIAHGDSRPSTTSSSSTSKIPAVSPLPPILKKPDAPPSSGPRPSVGFASPESSDVEGDDEVEEESSISTNSQGIGEPTSTDSKISKLDKKGKKKSQPFVASRGGKKRPMIVRRTSSKSSAEFKGGLPLSNVTSPSTEIPPIIELPSKSKGKGKVVTVSKFQENFSVSPEKLSKKPKAAKGKGRAKSKEHREPSRDSAIANTIDVASTLRSIENMSPNSNGGPGPSTVRNMRTTHTATAEEDLTIAELEELEMQKVLFNDFERQREREKGASRIQATASEHLSAHNNPDLEVSPSSRPPQIPRQSAVVEKIVTSKPNSTSEKSLPLAGTIVASREFEKDRGPKEKCERANSRVQTEAAEARENNSKAPIRSQPLKSKSSITTSKNFASAAGQLDIGPANTGPSVSAISTDKGKGKEKVDDMFAKRPIPSLPTGPSALSASVPSAMARSKSQLSLLLEKDRVRSGEKEKDRDGKKKKGGSNK